MYRRRLSNRKKTAALPRLLRERSRSPLEPSVFYPLAGKYPRCGGRLSRSELSTSRRAYPLLRQAKTPARATYTTEGAQPARLGGRNSPYPSEAATPVRRICPTPSTVPTSSVTAVPGYGGPLTEKNRATAGKSKQANGAASFTW